MTENDAIRTEALTKHYGEFPALVDLDLTVTMGEVYGFLGPNGAGKTTMIRTILDEIRPVGARYSVVGADQARCTASLVLMFRILYRFLTSLAHLAARSGRSNDLEIIVLRHQLAVLRRQAEQPQLTDDDRTLLGAIAAALPRPRRAGWIVTPRDPAPLAPTSHRPTLDPTRPATRTAIHRRRDPAADHRDGH